MLKIIAFASTLSVIALGAFAQQKPVVVELFTSQGCSSCPPADALLSELALRDDVLALSFHVDYWDYIGWKDTFADPGFTKRQYAYASAAGHQMVYTPQMIINGKYDVVGNRTSDVHTVIAAQSKMTPRAYVRAQRKGDHIQIEGHTTANTLGPLEICLVSFTPKAVVSIQRGENAGRELTYTNIVRHFENVGDWDGDGPLKLTVPVGNGTAALAVLLQQRQTKEIISAAVVE